MNEGINLLTTTKVQKPIEPKNVRLVRNLGLGILFVIGGSSIALFILISFSPLPDLQKEEQSLLSELQANRTSIGALTTSHQRVGDLRAFITSRKDYPEILGLVKKQLPSNTVVTGMKAEKQLFTVTIESESLQALDEVINRLENINKEKNTFTKANMNSLGLNNGSTAFSLVVEFVLL